LPCTPRVVHVDEEVEQEVVEAERESEEGPKLKL
jgi:hypothetical protein